MRGFGKILMVAVVAAPIGFMAATPSGAAAPTSATCKAMAGSEVFTPPLPLKGSVALTVTIKNAKLTGCTGAGGATGAGASSAAGASAGAGGAGGAAGGGAGTK